MGGVLPLLHQIRTNSGLPLTNGLSDNILESFLDLDVSLSAAIQEASVVHSELIQEFGQEFMLKDEAELIELLQSRYINFYAAACINPYVAIAARGPWIVTSHGAVLHDNGGYGMLGMGHAPTDVTNSMSNNWVMANVMTPSFSQKRLADRLIKEVGHKRGHCPYSRFICMNSGSESVTVSLRIADVNANRMTGPGGPHEGRDIKFIALSEGFHGRTDRAAQISDSCKDGYDRNLASFRNRENLIIVSPNDIDSLRQAFQSAEDDGIFIEIVAMEPVMGEGNPGMSISREFYDEARRLCNDNGSLLLVDSIQAGLRGRGCLSIVDYPGFEDCAAPDFETWSKALNAAQYPLSIVGLSERAAELYVVGIYGNTMTTNPRALETAISVLDRITPALRSNIVEKGEEFLDKLNALAKEFPDAITLVQGTGLLLSAELNPEKYPVVGFDAFEQWCRFHGLGIIHGGQNALRFTPHFNITSAEIDLIIDILRQGLIEFDCSAAKLTKH